MLMSKLRRLLSYLPFFPESDGLRRASVINTDIGNRNYIHELFIENLEKTHQRMRRQQRKLY